MEKKSELYSTHGNIWWREKPTRMFFISSAVTRPCRECCVMVPRIDYYRIGNISLYHWNSSSFHIFCGVRNKITQTFIYYYDDTGVQNKSENSPLYGHYKWTPSHAAQKSTLEWQMESHTYTLEHSRTLHCITCVLRSIMCLHTVFISNRQTFQDLHVFRYFLSASEVCAIYQNEIKHIGPHIISFCQQFFRNAIHLNCTQIGGKP